MPTVKEEYRALTGDNLSRNVGFLVEDALDEQDAIEATYNTAPSLLPDVDPRGNQLSLTSIEVSEVDASNLGLAQNAFRTTAIYQYRYNCPKVSYDFAGVAVRQTQSLQTKQRYKNASDPTDLRDFDRAIESTAEGDVQGADVLKPSGVMTMLWHPLNTFDADEVYFTKINGMVGKVNDAVFFGWQQEECQLAAIVSNLLDSDNRWEIEFRFNVGQSVSWGTDELLPGFGPSIEPVRPFDLLWFTRYPASKSRTTGGPYTAPKVIQVNHERVVELDDFRKLFTDTQGAYGVVACPGVPPQGP